MTARPAPPASAREPEPLLLPCPCCGGEPSSGVMAGEGAVIFCLACELTTRGFGWPENDADSKPLARAIAAWNARPAPAEPPGGLAALAERVEREEPSRDLWREAFCAARPMPAGMLGFADWNTDIGRFSALVGMGALIDAADMLRPEGWILDQIFDIGRNGETTTVMFYKDHLTDKVGGVATGPHAEARARLAAALRARAALAAAGEG